MKSCASLALIASHETGIVEVPSRQKALECGWLWREGATVLVSQMVTGDSIPERGLY